MKILLVHNSYQHAGGEDAVFRQEKELLQRSGHQVITYERSNFEVNTYQGPSKLKLAKNVIWNSRTRREFAHLLRREKPDLVHMHNTFMVISPSVYYACHEADVPIVQTLHNYRFLCPAANFFRDGHRCEECLDHSLLRSIEHACYRESSFASAIVASMLKVHRVIGTYGKRIDRYIALSEFSRQRFIAGGLPADKISTKPNFIDPDPGARSSDGEYALFVGRLSPEKGLNTLLDAWSRVPNVPLKIVGEGPMFHELRAQVERRKLSNVHLAGKLLRQEALDAIRGARFLVLPSECYENFPMTIVEAFACGTPVICSRFGAMQELVTDQQTGLHFTLASGEDLAAKVDWAWQHRSQMGQMGKQARSEYEAKYTAERNYLLLMEIYRNALASAPATFGAVSLRNAVGPKLN
jgi:glycosyltransferase involved in cell wall biosynthesis